MEIKKDKDSRWFDVELVPESYIFSPKDRPQHLDVAICDSIPVVDLAKNIEPIESILKASQEFGFFQVINHGVPEKITSDAMSVLQEFFDMPSKEATGYVPHNKGWIYTNNDCTKDGVHIWRENLKHLCHPLDKCTKLWPNKPTRYQEAIAAYLLEINKLSFRILEMICEGLGLEPGYCSDTSEVQILSSNFYPSCPDPSLTLGILAHQDTSLITLVYQGNQLEIVSNGKLRSIDHRVVTTKALVNKYEPSRYKASRYKEYVDCNKAFGAYTVALRNVVISES
nr:hyoscyamine 6-dioxygenase-like [Tanacetum cinerariifolium]